MILCLCVTNPGTFILHVNGRTKMTALLNYDHRAAGTVRFDASVSIEQLAGFLAELKSRHPERWVDLHIRGAGKDREHYIAFHYILADGKKKTHDKAVFKLVQFLGDRLGWREDHKKSEAKVPNGVMGWSISSVMAVA